MKYLSMLELLLIDIGKMVPAVKRHPQQLSHIFSHVV